MGGSIPEYDLESLEFIDESETNEKTISSYKIAGFEKDASFLISHFPPILSSPNKKLLFKICNNEKVEWKGKVKFGRFSEMNLPRKFGSLEEKVQHVCKENVFTYTRLDGYDDSVQRDWHVNFADCHLFGYYGGGLFAQDEMQAAEMPILASVREFLRSSEIKELKNDELAPLTRKGSFASPCLTRNAQRRICVSVDRNVEKGRPSGLYGNRFRMASMDTIQKATKLFHEPQMENIISMEAPKNQSGKYTLNTILFILRTAYTGFRAARAETWAELGDGSKTCVHTGNWGTGAYGGNKIIMALLQIAAAELAGIDILVFHSFMPEYTKAYEKARKYYREVVKEVDGSVLDFVQSLENQEFKWGVSDGN